MHVHGNGRTAAGRVGAGLVLCAAVAHGGQPEPVGSAAREALALCQEADRVPVAEGQAVLAWDSTAPRRP